MPITRQVLDSCLETLGVTPQVRADIALALSEACANVIQHAQAGAEYEVQVSAKNRRCAIEVVNTGGRDGEPTPAGGEPAGSGPDEAQPDWFALRDDPVSVNAEHGRGLKIIDAVADNLTMVENQRQGTTVHFEKTLEWLPGAAGERLFTVRYGAA